MAATDTHIAHFKSPEPRKFGFLDRFDYRFYQHTTDSEADLKLGLWYRPGTKGAYKDLSRLRLTCFWVRIVNLTAPALIGSTWVAIQTIDDHRMEVERMGLMPMVREIQSWEAHGMKYHVRDVEGGTDLGFYCASFQATIEEVDEVPLLF